MSSSLRKLGSEEKENEETGQRQTVEAIDLDSRNGLLLLLLMQQLMIVWVTALELESLLNREKQQCFETLGLAHNNQYTSFPTFSFKTNT